MIRNPLAGNVLAYFHYVLGFRRLGHDVLYLEESGWPKSCYDPVTCTYGDDPRAGLRLVRSLMADYGGEVPICYVNRDSGNIEGASWADLKRVLASADFLLNIGGVCWLPEFRLCRRLALIDMDPVFSQIGRIGVTPPSDHHVRFSYGVNIGRPGCTVPTGGLDWLPTLPPVVPEMWQDRASMRSGQGDSAADGVLTTVASWKAYGAVTYQGERYGQKNEEFLRLLNLPSRTPQRLELAVSGGGDGEVEQLLAAGWSIRDAGEVSSDVPTYRAYISGSRGEFSVAKQAYVKARSGWFSDRSICYLAAGLPVILQDTGFSDWLPTGRGVLAFSSSEEAAECIERVNAEYMAHCRAAREIADRKFSYRVVLPYLLEAVSHVRRFHQLGVELVSSRTQSSSRMASGGFP
jgi:hypothetical protein